MPDVSMCQHQSSYANLTIHLCRILDMAQIGGFIVCLFLGLLGPSTTKVI